MTQPMITEQDAPPVAYENLPPDIQEQARDGLRETQLEYIWYDAIYDDAKAIGVLMGIHIEHIYFSGFASQGDGACFDADYSPASGAPGAVKRYAPLDKELHRIAEGLTVEQCKIALRGDEPATALVKQLGPGYHELCTEIYIETEGWGAVDYRAEEAITRLLRDYMKWIYRRLEAEADYLQSDESILELIDSMNYRFDPEDGALA